MPMLDRPPTEAELRRSREIFQHFARIRTDPRLKADFQNEMRSHETRINEEDLEWLKTAVEALNAIPRRRPDIHEAFKPQYIERYRKDYAEYSLLFHLSSAVAMEELSRAPDQNQYIGALLQWNKNRENFDRLRTRQTLVEQYLQRNEVTLVKFDDLSVVPGEEDECKICLASKDDGFDDEINDPPVRTQCCNQIFHLQCLRKFHIPTVEAILDGFDQCPNCKMEFSQEVLNPPPKLPSLSQVTPWWLAILKGDA